jgi:excisionase family DNA binding protein
MSDHCGTFEAARTLGLSIAAVQGLVERGELGAWKTPGGHERIYLESVERYLHRHGKATPEPVPLPPGLLIRALVLEDDAVTLAVMRAAMESWKLPIECAYMSSGVEALLEVDHLRPDVLVTDLMMPGVDGFDLVASVARDPSLAALLIVAITSLSAEEIQAKGGLPERVQVLRKPANLPWLHGFFSALVAQRRLAKV